MLRKAFMRFKKGISNTYTELEDFPTKRFLCCVRGAPHKGLLL
jgi:hypothetical protein